MSKEQKRHEFMKEVPGTMKNIFLMAFKRSKASAVKAKCLECSSFQRTEVALCNIVVCPLWEVRPFRKDLVKEKRSGKGCVPENLDSKDIPIQGVTIETSKNEAL